MRSLLPLLSLTALLGSTSAHAVAPLPPQFDGVDVKNKLGQSVDRNIPFMAEGGRVTSFADFLDGAKGGRPVLLTLNYFRCTSLCSQQLNDLLLSIKKIGWTPGQEKFRIVTISFDPTDTVDTAAGKQLSYRIELARALAENNGETDLSDAVLAERAKSIDWTFLVGRDKAIRAIAENLGYYFRYDEATRQYAHSPVVYVLSPEGVITRYLWGLEIPHQDLKFALMEASDGVLGSFGDKFLASCFVFEDGKYHAFAWGIMRIGASLAALVLGIWLFIYWRRDKNKRSASASGPTRPVGQGV